MFVKDHNLVSLKLSSKQRNEQKQKIDFKTRKKQLLDVVDIFYRLSSVLTTYYNRSTEAVCEILRINEEQFHTLSFLENYLILKFQIFFVSIFNSCHSYVGYYWIFDGKKPRGVQLVFICIIWTYVRRLYDYGK